LQAGVWISIHICNIMRDVWEYFPFKQSVTI
jgi:hypothetical protein